MVDPFIEYVKAQNYLNTERWITKSRWFAIGFLFLYLNLLKPEGWPRGLFNSLFVLVAIYNFGISFYLKKTKFFSIIPTLVFLYLDMLALAVGLFYTGGVNSPFLFIWYLTLFAISIRFGFRKTLFPLVPMALFYAWLIHRDLGCVNADSFSRLLLGLSTLAAAALFGNIFAREERFTMKVMADFRKASIMDELTGLHNYAFFIDRLKHEQYRADRDNSHFSVIIFDLDHFKQVNDTYGHEKGNVLLRTIAGIIKMNARRMDTVARYGGEEFVILMPESRGAEQEVAERIRKKIEETEFSGIAQGPFRITISGGLCTYPTDAKNTADILTNADRALYAAKSAGRNKTCRCGELEQG